MKFPIFQFPFFNFQRFALVALLFLAGCLPHGCQRRASEAVFPADSLSRRVAATMPMDTLHMVWRADSAGGGPLKAPRDVHFGPDGRLYVADIERGSVFAFTPNGQFLGSIGGGRLEAPRLAGTRSDTVLVLAPAQRRLYFVAEGHMADNLRLSIDLPTEEPKVWAAASEEAFFIKAAKGDTAIYVARLNRRGAVETRRVLPPPAWRRAGPLQLWNGTLASFSRYRPEALLFPSGLSASIDTLAFVGFNSPMLARSRSFILGDVGAPPVLIEGVAPAGEWLFVLNLRPGWLRIDVFGPEGRLVHRLTQADPAAYAKNYYPRDLAVRRRPDGSYDLAVTFSYPEPAVELYRWRPLSATGRKGDGATG